MKPDYVLYIFPATLAHRMRDRNKIEEEDWQIGAKRSIVKKVNEKRPRAILNELEHAKASIRAKAEPSFHVVKNLLRHRNRIALLINNLPPYLINRC
jgi:hypothetical protein